MFKCLFFWSTWLVVSNLTQDETSWQVGLLEIGQEAVRAGAWQCVSTVPSVLHRVWLQMVPAVRDGSSLTLLQLEHIVRLSYTGYETCRSSRYYPLWVYHYKWTISYTTYCSIWSDSSIRIIDTASFHVVTSHHFTFTSSSSSVTSTSAYMTLISGMEVVFSVALSEDSSLLS